MRLARLPAMKLLHWSIPFLAITAMAAPALAAGRSRGVRKQASAAQLKGKQQARAQKYRGHFKNLRKEIRNNTLVAPQRRVSDLHGSIGALALVEGRIGLVERYSGGWLNTSLVLTVGTGLGLGVVASLTGGRYDPRQKMALVEPVLTQAGRTYRREYGSTFEVIQDTVRHGESSQQREGMGIGGGMFVGARLNLKLWNYAPKKSEILSLSERAIRVSDQASKQIEKGEATAAKLPATAAPA